VSRPLVRYLSTEDLSLTLQMTPLLEEDGVSGIDWMDTPLREFLLTSEVGEDGGTTGREMYLHGEGAAQDVLFRLYTDVDAIYGELVGPEDSARLEETGEVPVIREGTRHYQDIDTLALRDLPAVLDTFVVLEEEREREKLEEAQRKAAERKERERVRAKERRKLKKLGEW
jgi:hypothetical protein